jgi:hypothetical protein
MKNKLNRRDTQDSEKTTKQIEVLDKEEVKELDRILEKEKSHL